MGLNLNQVIVSGRLARDSECRALQSGSRVVTFSICVNFSLRRNDNGEWEEEVCWINVNRWYTEKMQPIQLFKGDEVVVCGRLQEHRYTPKDSQKEVSEIRLVADTVRVATYSKNRPQNEGQPQPQGAINYGQPQNGYGNASQYGQQPQGYGQQPQQQYATPAQRAATQYLPTQQYSPVEAYARQQQEQQQAQGNPPPQQNADEGDLPF